MTIITPDDLLLLFRQGLFPMADSRAESGFYIVEPRERALLPITTLHISHSLKKALRKNPFEIRVDTAFPDVIRGCAEARKDTWINSDIESLFVMLHEQGHAHSVECWQNRALMGGLYGLAIGSVFCGESMFSKATNASKIALVYLTALLDQGGFTLLDAQFTNPHLEQFGLYEMPQGEYITHLKSALNDTAQFPASVTQETVRLVNEKL